MTWRPTEFEDLHRINLPDADAEADVRSILPDTEQSREMLYADARTWEDDGELLAIVGVAFQWKGVGVVWTLITDAAKARGVVLTRGVVRFLNELYNERGYWRLQATVEEGDDEAHVWIFRLGFSHEGTMTAYAPDQKTHDLYARVEL